MFAGMPTVESQVEQQIATGDFDGALMTLMQGVQICNHQKERARLFLYLPLMDRQLEQLARALPVTAPTPFGQPLSTNTLVIASELYQVGGHTRVLADVVRELASPIIVLTDMLGRFKKTPEYLNWLLAEFEGIPLVMLCQTNLWKKCNELHLLTQRLRPQNILYFNHHEDPIPFVGTLGHAGSRKTLVHHCDHSPSLGNTLAGVGHVDFTVEAARNCAGYLQREALVLPLYVTDQGEKSFATISGNHFSVVTSGTHIKFVRTGELALQNIALTVLSNVTGEFFHIGALDAQWVAEIRAHLDSNGIAPDRFVAVGPVASVWKTLLELNAHVYLGSAPLGGGRAAIEAQGCGYPVAFFQVLDQGPAIGADSIYASKELGWGDLSELADVLKMAGEKHARWSAQARQLYATEYSRAEFVRCLQKFTGEKSPVPTVKPMT